MKIANRLCLLFALASAPLLADVVFDVSIDTSSLAPGATGFIDLAFNGGFPDMALVSGFTGATVDPTTLFTQGTISGTLPGTVSIGDDNADYNEAVALGSMIDFTLAFSGTPGGISGDTFTVSFFGTDDATPLLTADENDGFLLKFDLGTGGTVNVTAFDSPTGGPSLAGATEVPEPSETGLLLAAVIVALLFRRRCQSLLGRA